MSKTLSLARKAVSFALTVILAFMCFSVISVTTASAYERGTINYNKKLYDNNQAVCDVIEEGVRNFSPQIYVSGMGVTADNAAYIFKTVLKRNPDIFFVNSQRFTIGKDESGIAVIVPTYLYSQEEYNKMAAELNAKAESILSSTYPLMTDFEKAVCIHDAIVLNCEYYDNELRPTSVYDALVKGVANCQGYSAAYSYLLSFAGIDSEIVESSEMFHVWNRVNIDGNWYNSDITWDDPLADRPGRVDHEYFLLSDKAISEKEDGDKRLFGFDFAYFHCTDTKYDNCLYHEFDTKFCFVNGKCYVIGNHAYSDYKNKILIYDTKNDTASIEYEFNASWPSGENKYWLGGYSYLDEYKGVLYYNTVNSVSAYNTLNGKNTEFYSDNKGNKFYGLIIRDENVYVYISENPNVQGTLSLVNKCDDFGNVVIKTEDGTGKRVYLLGDVDLSGEVSIDDVTAIQKYLANIIGFSDEQIALADFDNTDDVNIDDATAIQKFLAGIF